MFTLNDNEFLANLTNLALQVLTFDQITFKQPFGVFKRQYTKWGDKIACVTAFAHSGRDYNTQITPYDMELAGDSKPTAYESTIKTKLKKMYPLTLSNEILKGAFEDENSLGVYLNTLLAQLVTFSEIDIYEKIIADFATMFSDNTKADAVLSIANNKYNGVKNTGSLAKESATECYRQILQTAREMKLPNEQYGLLTNGSKQRLACAMGQDLVLILTPEASALFDTYVNASLFNSKEIELSKSIKHIIVADIETSMTVPDGNGGNTPLDSVFAILTTDDVYRYSPRIESMELNRNGATMAQNYFYHVWTNMGFTGTGQVAIFHQG